MRAQLVELRGWKKTQKSTSFKIVDVLVLKRRVRVGRGTCCANWSCWVAEASGRPLLEGIECVICRCAFLSEACVLLRVNMARYTQEGHCTTALTTSTIVVPRPFNRIQYSVPVQICTRVHTVVSAAHYHPHTRRNHRSERQWIVHMRAICGSTFMGVDVRS